MAPNHPHNIPFSVYIHMPWCVQKCPYCDFNSHAVRGKIPQQSYIQQLCKEWDSLAKQASYGRPIHSIFIGGGTPSLIKPQLIEQLLAHITSQHTCEDKLEITLEANPGTLDKQHIQALPACGINRLSLGVQSFQAQHLKMLGRIHSAQQAVEAFQAARMAGFTNINLDLMHGLPGQNVSQAINDLEQAVALGPEHISWYQLTLEANTYFARFPPRLPDDSALAEIQAQGQAYLQKKGFIAYEVSAYCKANAACRHNLNYWNFGDYLGLGAGAHSKITHPDGRVTRHSNLKHPKAYLQAQTNPANNFIYAGKSEIKKPPSTGYLHSQHTILQAYDLVLEFMLCALRLSKPIKKQLLTQRTGISWQNQDLQKSITQAASKKLMHITAETFTPSTLGARYLNELLEIFLD